MYWNDTIPGSISKHPILFEHRWQVMLGTCMADHICKFRPHLTTFALPTAESIQRMYWGNPIPGSIPKTSDPI